MFWNRFVEVCEKNGLRPRKVAAEIGVAAATVTRWKNGSVPQNETLDKLAKKFGVSVAYFLTEDDEFCDISDILMDKSVKQIVSLCRNLNEIQKNMIVGYITELRLDELDEETEKRKAKILEESNFKEIMIIRRRYLSDDKELMKLNDADKNKIYFVEQEVFPHPTKEQISSFNADQCRGIANQIAYNTASRSDYGNLARECAVILINMLADSLGDKTLACVLEERK